MPIGSQPNGSASGPAIRPRFVGAGGPLAAGVGGALDDGGPELVTVAANTGVGTGRVTIPADGSAVVVLEESANRAVATLVNEGAADVYVGPSNVAVATGFKLEPGASFTVTARCALSARTAGAAASTLAFLAEFA